MIESNIPDCGWRASPDDIGDRSRYCIRELGHNYTHLSEGPSGGRRSWIPLMDDLWDVLERECPVAWEVYDLHDAMLKYRSLYDGL